MIGEYSVMDWATVAGIVGVLIKMFRDNKLLSKEHDALSKEHADLSREHDRILSKISSEREILSKENQAIKTDTTYISDEMKMEKMARLDLYKSTSRAKEILETMDMMKEVVIQNSQLSAEVSKLTVENQILAKEQEKDIQSLSRSIERFERRLAEFEEYRDAEAIQIILRDIKNELSDF